jgi:repressor LexA
MTKKQKETLDFIREFWADKGYAPSYDDIADAVGLRSKSGINRLISALKERGWIDYIPNKARSIRVLGQ